MLMQRCRNYHFLWSQSYHWLEMFCLIVCLKSLMQWIDFCKNCFWTITPRKCKWVPWTTFSSYLVKQRTFSSVSFCWPKGNRSFFFAQRGRFCAFWTIWIKMLNSSELVLAIHLIFLEQLHFHSLSSSAHMGLVAPSNMCFQYFQWLNPAFKKMYKKGL